MTIEIWTLISNFCLQFTEEYTIILITIYGIVFLNKKTFFRALMLLMFSMVLNKYLKFYFQVPLPEGVPGDFAFPSGHMQSAVVFYGWLAFACRSKFVYILFLLLSSIIGIALTQKGYHYPADTWAAFAVGIAIIGFYGYLQRGIFSERSEPYAPAILGLLGLGFLLLIPQTYGYLYGSLAALVGLTLAWRIQPKGRVDSFTDKIATLIFAVCGTLGIIYGATELIDNPIIREPLKFFTEALWIGWLAEATYLKTKRILWNS